MVALPPRFTADPAMSVHADLASGGLYYPLDTLTRDYCGLAASRISVYNLKP